MNTTDYQEQALDSLLHSNISLNTHTGNTLTNNVSGSLNTNVGNVSHSYNNILNLRPSQDTLPIQAWLSPLEPHKRHQDVRNLRLDGIGDWVLKTSEFESWHRGSSEKPVLLCFGSQGVGKTYIRSRGFLKALWARLTKNENSSLVIDTLRNQTHGQNAAVFSLYCDYQARKDQSTVNMIGGLLKQVVARAPEVPGEIKHLFEESRKLGGQGLRLIDMVQLFVKAISSFERVSICIDAVDELLAKDRPDFLRALRHIIDGALNTRLFLTGRPYIRGELDRYLTGRAYIIPVVADQGDIARYVQLKMDDDPHPGLMSEDLRRDIMKTMSEKTSGM